MIDEDRILDMNEGISRQILGAGEGAVVLTIATGQLYTCNDTTAKFLESIDGKRTFGEVVDALSRTYSVPREELRTDFSELAEKLITDGILR
jgi:hypothetical protein